MYIFIWNFCLLLKLIKGWGIDLERVDIWIGDDIECLRLFWNIYYVYVSIVGIFNIEFEDIWNDLKLVIKRI